MRTPRAVLFDLDGTVADTIGDIVLGLNTARAERGLAPATEEQVRRWVGDGAPKLIARSLGTEDVDAPGVAPLLDALKRGYIRVSGTCSQVLPGVLELVRDLRERGVRVALTTNKPRYATDVFLERMGLAPEFDVVLTPQDVDGRHKPDPAMFFAAAAALDVAPPDCLIVGDGTADVLGGRAAGMPVVAVTGGYGDPARLLEAGPTHTIRETRELRGLLER